MMLIEDLELWEGVELMRVEASGTRAKPASTGDRHPMPWVEALLSPSLRALVLLLSVSALFGFLQPGVLELGNLSIVLMQAVPLALVALGTSIVLLSGSIDLSVGATVSFAAISLALSVSAGDPLFLTICKVLGAALLVGIVNGLLAGFLKLPAFVVTLGTMTALAGVTLLLSGSISVGQTGLGSMAAQRVVGVRLDIWFLVGIAIVLHVFLTRTFLGISLRGVGSNEGAASKLGVDPGSVRFVAFLISALLAGLAALVIVARTPVVTPQLGGSLLLDAFAAAVIGGTSIFGGRGSVFGTLCGAVIVTFIRNFLITLGVDAASVELYRGLIILLALLADAGVASLERRRKGVTRVYSGG